MVDVTEHDRRGRPQPEFMGGDHHLCPLGGPDLVRAEMCSDIVVEDLGGGSRKGAQTGGLELLEKAAHRYPQGLGPLPDLERGEAVDVHVGQLRFDGIDHVDIEVAGEIGMDPTLKGHFGRTPPPGLERSLHDLVEAHEIRLAAEIEAARALGKGAEATA